MYDVIPYGLKYDVVYENRCDSSNSKDKNLDNTIW